MNLLIGCFYIGSIQDKYEDELFFNKKKRYVIDLCVVCDFNKRFTYFLCEGSNSQHDQRVFVVEDLHKHSSKYFFARQYLLDDNAYINTSYLITSYKVSHIKHVDVRRFNRRLARVRIDIEHVFEMLKKRGKNLTRLRILIRDLKSYIFAIRGIIACVMLHNFLLNIQNDGNENEKGGTFEKENAHEKNLKNLNDQQLIEKLNKKKHVKRMILKHD